MYLQIVLNSIMLILAVILSYIGYRYLTLEKEILKYIKKNYPDAYRECSISLNLKADTKTLLGQRILKNPEKLPHDKYLDEKYKTFRELFWLIIIIPVIFVIHTIFFIINVLSNI